MIKTIRDFNPKGKRVFVRCDFNIPIKEGVISDDFKIEKSLPTIKYLRERGAKLILASHLGRPLANGERRKKKEFSLLPVKNKLERVLGEKIIFSKKIGGWRVKVKTKKIKNGQIMMIENLRFNKGEESNSEKFAKKLSKLADYYVNEAFSVSHRSHASIVGIPQFLPHFAGLQMEKEIETLAKILKNPDRPLVVIIGGAKIETKVNVIDKFSKFADYLLLGGKTANAILAVKGISVGRPWPSPEAIKMAKKINLTDTKIHLPADVLVSPDKDGNVYVRETGPGSVRKEEEILDIGEETVKKFSRIIMEGKTIFWSGPLGFFENEKFSQGTKNIIKALGENRIAFKVAGGGDTVAAIKRFNAFNDFSFVSTGGGAMLEFLSGKELPGIKALERE